MRKDLDDIDTCVNTDIQIKCSIIRAREHTVISFISNAHDKLVHRCASASLSKDVFSLQWVIGLEMSGEEGLQQVQQPFGALRSAIVDILT